MTETEMITYFCIIDDVLKDIGVKDEPQEGVIAHIAFAGNYKQAIEMLREGFRHLFPYVPSLSRFSRRMRKLKPYLQLIIQRLGIMVHKPKRFIVDSKPIKVEGGLHDLEVEVIGDRAYVNYEFEEELKGEGIVLNPVRRANERKYEGEWLEYFKRSFKRLIETVFSMVYRFLGLRPYAPTKEGIILKIFMAVLSFNPYRGYKLGLWS